MKHLQPQTLRVYLAILTSPRFNQRDLWRALNREGTVSVGMVNEVVNSLVTRRFVERTKRTLARAVETTASAASAGPSGGYVLSDPVGLLQFISMFRRMPDLRRFTRRVRAGHDEAVRELAARGAVFCIGTAMEMYSQFFRSEEVSFYSSDPDPVQRWLDTAAAGNTQVSCYRPDYVRSSAGLPGLFRDSLFAGSVAGIQATTRVQTAIDMFCDGKGAYAAPILRELWGVEL
jgi:hypothetical protein